MMQLLSHPELQYFAMSALVVLLTSPGSAVYDHPQLAGNAVEEVRAAITIPIDLRGCQNLLHVIFICAWRNNSKTPCVM